MAQLLQGGSQEMRADLIAWFMCVLSTTYHVKSCIYCLRYNQQRAALDNETVFWVSGRLWNLILMFAIHEWEEVNCYCWELVSSVFWGKFKIWDWQMSCEKGEIPSFYHSHVWWILIFQGAKIDFACFVKDCRTCCFCRFKVHQFPLEIIAALSY